MKKLIILLILIAITSSMMFADSGITRGPDVGEIYFLGPTATGEGLYRSTDFGETATCMDSTLYTNIDFGRITADLTPGVIYAYSMPENLWVSYNYGQEGSWIFRSDTTYYIQSGRTEGYIYKGFAQHSEDYGDTFITHECQGNFGNTKDVEIDNENYVGYKLTYESNNNDSLWLLISYDNFENFEIQQDFNWYGVNNYNLTRGFENGELYLMRRLGYGDGSTATELWYSDDYGENWVFKNHLLSSSIVGGRQQGELFVRASYTQLMGLIKHVYIYHSLDYGETFTVYHPFAYGQEPYYANFEAEPTTGTTPFTTQFTDLSSGEDIYVWEWDFDLDGTIDSYEQNPEFTYQDTGYYNVKLTIQRYAGEDAIVKTYYIHVIDGNGAINNNIEIENYNMRNYPNPLNPITTISYNLPENQKASTIEIFNLKGQLVDEIEINNQQTEAVWNANGYASGIYLYKLNIENSPIKKMILLK